MFRIDGEGRGLAVGVGAVFAPVPKVELELAGLRSSTWGAYVGLRVQFLENRWARVRPYGGAGLPLFIYTNEATSATELALGLRGAVGVEVWINCHLSLITDLDVEHFFNLDGVLVENAHPDANVFVPTLGAVGRL